MRDGHVDGVKPNTQEAGLLEIEIRCLGKVVTTVQTEADPSNPAALRSLLIDAARRNGDTDTAIGDYEMIVRHPGQGDVITTFVTTAR